VVGPPLLVLLVSQPLAQAPSPSSTSRTANDPTFTAAAFSSHVRFLADDLLEGRMTGTRGYDLAAAYVATRLEALGLKPAVDNGWYQKVPFRESRLVADRLPTIAIGGKPFTHPADVLMFPSMREDSESLEGNVIFAGFCFDKRDLGFDDFAGLDVKGKIVACLTGFPKGTPSDLGAHLADQKQTMAEARGAIGVLQIPTIEFFETLPWSKLVEYANVPAMTWKRPDGAPHVEAPGIRIGALLNTAAREALFAGSPRSLTDVLAEANTAGGKPKGFALRQPVTLERHSQFRDLQSTNVLGVLSGSDPAVANEFVVLMGHLDHIGVKTEKSGDQIFNGAMDNAAGIAALLEAARAFAESPTKPRRSILFAAVTGEEEGLLGSEYLAKHSVTPPGSLVAVVNLDMPVLLYDFVDVVAFGAEHSTLGKIVEQATARAGVKTSPDPLPAEGLFTRSDHYNFVKEGVPSVFLITGFGDGGDKVFGEFLATHYHQPSDQPDLPFNWAAGAKFARINYLIAREIADQAERPRWYRDSFFGNTFAASQPKADR
jgi:Zn-dependent M28 family amino/carboxypeptidase